MSRQRKQFGFTLVEIMVVLAIFAVLATAAVPSYQTWIQNTRIRNGAESILNGISRARAEALMRNTSVSFTLGANSAWTVECIDAAKCLDLPAGLVDSRDSSDGSAAEVSVTELPAGATQVIYTNLGVKSAAPGQLTQVAVDNTSMADSRELNVTIGAGGNVRMCDPNASSTDPRRC